MRQTTLLAIILVLAIAPLAVAAPTPGTYNTPSLGGTMLEGRATNSWSMPANGAMGMNDVWNSMSWDGSLLGTEWKFQCATSPAMHAVVDNRIAGTGTVIITAAYDGGTFFMSKDGPWGDGLGDDTGTLSGTTIITTLQYVSNVLVDGRENISASGIFDEDGCFLTFLLTNGIRVGDTTMGPKPMGYPGFLAPDCSPTRTDGSWSDIVDVSVRIDCPVSVEESTWGRIKSNYR